MRSWQRGAKIISELWLYLNSFTPLCWYLWRLRWDLRVNLRPQSGIGHTIGRCGQSHDAFTTSSCTNFLFSCMFKLFSLTAPVCTVSCSFSLLCLVNVAPQSSRAQLKICGGAPPAGFSLRTPFIFLVSKRVSLMESRPPQSARLIASWDGFNWLIGSVGSAGGESRCFHRLDTLHEPQRVKMKLINLITTRSSAVRKVTWNTGKSAHAANTQRHRCCLSGLNETSTFLGLVQWYSVKEDSLQKKT